MNLSYVVKVGWKEVEEQKRSSMRCVDIGDMELGTNFGCVFLR